MDNYQLPPVSEHPVDNPLNVSHPTLFYVEGVTVSFDGFKALNDLSFYLDTGELRCIIGPNGAGKTTMMDVITGRTRPDEGALFFGQSIDLLKLDEPQIAQIGIGRKSQKPTVFEQHSVFENLELAMAGRKGVWSTLFARLSGEQRDRIAEVLGISASAARAENDTQPIDPLDV